jgi:hypothetical protein
MIVRPGQMAVFEQDAFRRMQERLVAHVRQHHADEVKHLGVRQLEREVEAGMIRAQDYSLTLETTIGAFVSLRFVIGPEFDRQPDIHAALSDPKLQPDDRMDTLMERTQADHWAEAMNGKRKPA